MKARRKWISVSKGELKVLEKNGQLRIQFSIKIFFKNESEIKTFWKNRTENLLPSNLLLSAKDCSLAEENDPRWKLKDAGKNEEQQKW